MHGGPAVLTGELATLVTYRCVVVVRTPAGTTTTTAAFDSSGPVAVLPPAPVAIPATAQRVSVCTEVEWYFGFPGGGLITLGCRDAAPGPTGWELTPEVLT